MVAVRSIQQRTPEWHETGSVIGLAAGASQSAIAREYGVVHQLINAVALRRVWRHVA